MLNEDLMTEVGSLPNGNLYITINGIMRLAKEIGLSVTEIVADHSDKEWHYEIRATDPDGRHRWGSATELKSKKFSRSMCINKAQRNAFGLFLRKHPQVEEAIAKYTASNPGRQQSQRPQQSQQAQQRQQNNSGQQQKQAAPPQAAPPQTALEKNKIAALQAFKVALPKLEKEGISEATFWDSVKAYFKCEKSDQMTAENWAEIQESLTSNPIAAWIKEQAIAA